MSGDGWPAVAQGTSGAGMGPGEAAGRGSGPATGDRWQAAGPGDAPPGRPERGAAASGDRWSPVASHSEVTFGRGRSEWPPERTADGNDLGPIHGRTDDEVTAGDMAWGEPMWSDAVPADPPPPAVDWRKSIPREFVARTSPAPAPAAPTANGQTYPATSAPGTGPGVKPSWPAESEDHDDAPPSAGRHVTSGGRDEPARANGINGVNGTAQPREPATRDAPTGPGAGPRSGEPDDDLAPGPEDTGVWNQLDREIARALATALAGKLAQYVTGPILPLVADELARMVGSSASADESGEGHDDREGRQGGDRTGERRPRHFGDGTPRH